MLYLYLGTPKVGSLLAEDIDEVAISWGISYEAAVIKCLDVLVNSLGKHNAGGATYFDLLMCECFQKKMSAPKIKLQTHGEGIRLPMLVLQNDLALHEPTRRNLPITNQMLNHFGVAFSEEFEIEYLGYERVGQSTPDSQHATTSPMDMVYIINDKNHIYDGNKFIPIQIAKPTLNKWARYTTTNVPSAVSLQGVRMVMTVVLEQPLSLYFAQGVKA